MIYFCIPTYNEERTVGVVLWKLRQVMAELQRDYQIIVVDDASTDSTPAVLSPYIRVLPLTVIRNSARRGYADSLELAIREALRRSPYPKRDAVITLQADFSEDPDAVPAMMKRFEAGADLVATEVAMEPTATRTERWGRRFMRWLMRRHEWSIVGDPLSGLRVYRVVTLKRALEARGTGRLLSHQGWGANVELLAQTVPHSRRNDVVETTLKQHRLQRPSRFAFMQTLRDVRAAASGKMASKSAPLPTDSVVAQPLPIAAEPVQHRQDRHQKRGGRELPQRRQRREREPRTDGRTRGPGTERPERSERPVRSERGERVEKKQRTRNRGPRPTAAPANVPAPETATEPVPAPETVPETAPAPEGEFKRKRKRRPRRRKQRAQDTNQTLLVLEPGDAPAAEAAEPDGAADQPEGDGQSQPKKKSRRGRRGGRGRRRGPKPSENGEIPSTTESSETPPPVVAEGD